VCGMFVGVGKVGGGVRERIKIKESMRVRREDGECFHLLPESESHRAV